MKTPNRYRKFQLQQKNIEALEKQSSRFKRVYSEYEHISEDLIQLETKEGESVPDDFMDAIITQASILEEEIEDWLVEFNKKKRNLNT